MKMVSKVHPKSVIKLPSNHFAILVEGAWLYSPEEQNNTRIIAACPYPKSDTGHCLVFGQWDGEDIVPVGKNPIEMPDGAEYRLDVQSDTLTKQDFRTFFNDASSRYPFVFLANTENQKSWTVDTSGMRTVSLPVPSELRVCGTLLTAEVDGAEIDKAKWNDQDVKRLCVTFIFIYEFKTKIDVVLSNVYEPAQWSAADDGTHLIFRVFPQTEDDDITEKCHTSMTFEKLRKRIQDGSTKTCFDVGVYHDRGPSKFDPGDTDLDADELGLPTSSQTGHSSHIHKELVNRKLAACAGGALVVDPTRGS